MHYFLEQIILRLKYNRGLFLVHIMSKMNGALEEKLYSSDFWKLRLFPSSSSTIFTLWSPRFCIKPIKRENSAGENKFTS